MLCVFDFLYKHGPWKNSNIISLYVVYPVGTRIIIKN